mmetsp:Transcript_5949/g.7283  ORF Transcript_5949/g.7283 Transcript_5949/m.7283 type:complete len:213 (-) Transcript_5949:520-1158(-)
MLVFVPGTHFLAGHTFCHTATVLNHADITFPRTLFDRKAIAPRCSSLSIGTTFRFACTAWCVTILINIILIVVFSIAKQPIDIPINKRVDGDSIVVIFESLNVAAMSLFAIRRSQFFHHILKVVRGYSQRSLAVFTRFHNTMLFECFFYFLYFLGSFRQFVRIQRFVVFLISIRSHEALVPFDKVASIQQTFIIANARHEGLVEFITVKSFS